MTMISTNLGRRGKSAWLQTIAPRSTKNANTIVVRSVMEVLFNKPSSSSGFPVPQQNTRIMRRSVLWRGHSFAALSTGSARVRERDAPATAGETRAASKSWCKAPRLATRDSRLRGNDDGQSAYWIHVIPAKAGIHLPYVRSLHEDFDATPRARRPHHKKSCSRATLNAYH